VIVFEDIHFEIFKILIAEGTTMMPSNCLLDAMTAIDMPAASDIAVSDLIEAYCALKLVLEFLCADSKAVVVKVVGFDLHLILFQLYYSLLDATDKYDKQSDSDFSAFKKCLIILVIAFLSMKTTPLIEIIHAKAFVLYAMFNQ
jgi:hypothetical protein